MDQQKQRIVHSNKLFNFIEPIDRLFYYWLQFSLVFQKWKDTFHFQIQNLHSRVKCYIYIYLYSYIYICWLDVSIVESSSSIWCFIDVVFLIFLLNIYLHQFLPEKFLGTFFFCVDPIPEIWNWTYNNDIINFFDFEDKWLDRLEPLNCMLCHIKYM